MGNIKDEERANDIVQDSYEKLWNHVSDSILKNPIQVMVPDSMIADESVLTKQRRASLVTLFEEFNSPIAQPDPVKSQTNDSMMRKTHTYTI